MPPLAAAPKRPVGALLALLVTGLLMRGLAEVAPWPWLYALLMLPGTLMHELAHWASAWLLGAQPQGFSVWPQRMPEGGWMLGSVQFVPNAWNVASIALSPLALLSVGGVLVRMASQVRGWLPRALCVYVAACAWGSAWPSSVDWRLAWHAVLSWPLGVLMVSVLVLSSLGLLGWRPKWR